MRVRVGAVRVRVVRARRLRPEAGHVRHVEEDEHLVRVRLRLGLIMQPQGSLTTSLTLFPNPSPHPILTRLLTDSGGSG